MRRYSKLFLHQKKYDTIYQQNEKSLSKSSGTNPHHPFYLKTSINTDDYRWFVFTLNEEGETETAFPYRGDQFSQIVALVDE